MDSSLNTTQSQEPQSKQQLRKEHHSSNHSYYVNSTEKATCRVRWTRLNSAKVCGATVPIALQNRHPLIGILQGVKVWIRQNVYVTARCDRHFDSPGHWTRNSAKVFGVSLGSYCSTLCYLQRRCLLIYIFHGRLIRFVSLWHLF